MKTQLLLSVAAWSASAALAFAADSADQLPELSPGRAPATFTLPGAVQYDFTANTNQLPYRVMVWAPADAKTQAYPVIYLLDGNTWFPAAAVEGWHFNNAIMVGIGVPSNEVAQWRRRRVIDLTPTTDQRRSDSQTGGGAAFADRLKRLPKSAVDAHYFSFANETHGSVSLATIGRALTFALQTSDPSTKQ
jgi:hypothetical protein